VSTAADDTVTDGGRLKVDHLIASPTPASASLFLAQNYRDFSIARLLQDSRYPSPSTSVIYALPLDLRRSRVSSSGEELQQHSESVASDITGLGDGNKQVGHEGRVAAVAASSNVLYRPNSSQHHQYCARRRHLQQQLLHGRHHDDEPISVCTSTVDDQQRTTDADNQHPTETRRGKGTSTV